MRAPRRGRKAPAGSYQMPEGTGARWAGLELLRREPLGRAASYRQRILLTRDALRRFLASKGFFVGQDNSPNQVHAVELAHEAQVMSEACRKLRRASCCVIGTLRTHTIRCQRGPTKNNPADAESPLKSRSFRLDVGSYCHRESHGLLLCLVIMRALRNFFSGQRPASAPRTDNAR